jgi:hypothetical protein
MEAPIQTETPTSDQRQNRERGNSDGQANRNQPALPPCARLFHVIAMIKCVHEGANAFRAPTTWPALIPEPASVRTADRDFLQCLPYQVKGVSWYESGNVVEQAGLQIMAAGKEAQDCHHEKDHRKERRDKIVSQRR